MTLPSLNTLNYQHLLYFWVVAREGTIARATEVLHLTQPTISTQLKTLEQSLGATLFVKRGRTLALTETGQLVFHYADEIFRTGRELTEALARGGGDRPTRLVVGISDSLPTLTTLRVLQPALALTPQFRLSCRIDKIDRLVADLASHALDVVVTDAPVPSSSPVRTYTTLLGECGVTIFGTESFARKYRRGFPRSLHGAPFVMQTENTALRRSLDAWCIAREIRPEIVCEAEDVALLQGFGQQGMGMFAAPAVVERDIRRQYGVQVVGRLPEVRERFYAVSVERKIGHPGVVAILEAARTDLFG